MSGVRRHLYLPTKDRSFWQVEAQSDLPLAYLAWGRRDFSCEFLPECLHEGWVCTLIEEGKPVMIIKGQRIELAPRQLVFIGPDCSFGWSSEKGSRCRFVQWMWKSLSHDFDEGVSRDSCFIRNVPRGKYLPLRENHTQCRREVLALDSQSPKYLHASRLVFEILVQRVLEKGGSGDLADARFQQAKQWMQTHLDSKEPIARLCDYLDISQSTLHRLFKACSSQSPAGYFQEMRMQEAKRLLAGRKLLIKEIAYTLGYAHLNDFSRAYKVHFGCAPSLHHQG